MTIVSTLPATTYAVDCVSDLITTGKLEVISAHPHNPTMRLALHVRILSSYRGASNEMRYNVSFKRFETSNQGLFTVPLWMVIPLNVYELSIDDLTFCLNQYLSHSDEGLDPEHWGLGNRPWGYSSDRAMRKVWELVRDIHYFNGQYPHQWVYRVHTLTGDAIITLTAESFTNQKADAFITIGISHVNGRFNWITQLERIYLNDEGLNALTQALEALILIDMQELYPSVSR